MDSYMKRQLDAHIMGTNIHHEDTVPHECPTCGRVKDIPMFFELGGWFYCNDDDPYCEKCQCAMEILDKEVK